MNKKSLILFLMSFIPICCFAQQDTVRISVIGLTCSSCSKSVEEKLMQLPFVQKVYMNLNNNEAKVVIDFSQKVDWNGVANAVIHAGFSVGTMRVPNCSKKSYALNGLPCKDKYVYVGPHAQLELPYYTLIGKKFLDKKSYTVWLQKIISQGYANPASVSYYYYY